MDESTFLCRHMDNKNNKNNRNKNMNNKNNNNNNKNNNNCKNDRKKRSNKKTFKFPFPYGDNPIVWYPLSTLSVLLLAHTRNLVILSGCRKNLAGGGASLRRTDGRRLQSSFVGTAAGETQRTGFGRSTTPPTSRLPLSETKGILIK